MSEKRTPQPNDLSRYDAMTTQELEQLLQADLSASQEAQLDDTALLHITDLLTARAEAPTPTASEAWESFQEHYLQDGPKAPEEAQPEKRRHVPLRRLFLIAALIALLTSIPLIVGVSQQERGQALTATWEDGHFTFTGKVPTLPTQPTQPDPEPTYASIQEALTQTGNDPAIAPTWIPNGFVCTDVLYDQQPIMQCYDALYQKGESLLRISIETYRPEATSIYEVNEELTELYQTNGTDYYLFYNIDRPVAIWYDAPFVCHITGDITMEELKQMIDSIPNA